MTDYLYITIGAMQLLLERPVDNPQPKDRCRVFGISDFQTETDQDGNPQVRLFWPYYSGFADEETVVDAEISSGGELESLDESTLYESITDESHATNTVVVLREPDSKLNYVVENSLTDREKKGLTIIDPDGDATSETVDFFSTGE